MGNGCDIYDQIERKKTDLTVVKNCPKEGEGGEGKKMGTQPRSNEPFRAN